MSFTNVQCERCKRRVHIDTKRYERGSKNKIYCSFKKCKKDRDWKSKDGTQEVKKW